MLRYCAEGRNDRFGVIEFCVGVDVVAEFKAAVREVEEDGWHDLYRREGEGARPTGQQYAEVCYVPNWIGHSKNSPDYRFIAIREPLRNPTLPGDGGTLSSHNADARWRMVQDHSSGDEPGPAGG